jgi:hypothetical protein
MPAGILYALTRPTHAALTETTYNKWYSEAHIQDAVKSGLADLAIRYKNTNADAEWPYLCIYRIPDLAVLSDPKVMDSIPTTHELLPEGKPWTELMDSEHVVLADIQKFEGQIVKDGEISKRRNDYSCDSGECINCTVLQVQGAKV